MLQKPGERFGNRVLYCVHQSMDLGSTPQFLQDLDFPLDFLLLDGLRILDNHLLIVVDGLKDLTVLSLCRASAPTGSLPGYSS